MSARTRRPRPTGPTSLTGLAGLLACVLLVTACSGQDTTASDVPAASSSDSSSASPSPSGSSHTDDGHGGSTTPPKKVPLRAGEKRVKLTMPQSYTPSAPTGVGTDDYRCFLLDPQLTRTTFLTGTNVLPDNPQVVHHVILFRVAPRQVAEARAKDASDPGEGWTCFGGTGLEGDFSNVNDANWLGAWAPGGGESVTPAGYGIRLPRGSMIVMQVHYNLLAGASPDQSSAQIRVAAAGADLTPVHTFLMPAPVELPCRPGHDASPLCDRATALADVKRRFGNGPGSTADLLYFLCGGTPVAAQVTSCTRVIPRGMTILGVAGHMHLLGRSIRIETNPGTPDARTILDIPIWDFDNQSLKGIEPVHLDAFQSVKVTCKHVQWLRDRLPAFAGQPERYVVWGEGTTDEMCLGMLQVAFD